jgi:4-amino-4-deoxy-L-arabinose transferase-like glycosyltransferase
LWCWALVPIAFFSLPQGKHHHYLLQATAPWAVLSAVGLVRLWRWLPTVNWLDRPWPLLVTVALPGEVALALAGAPLGRLLPAALVLWPLIVLAYWWVLSRPSLRVASIALFALLVPLHWLGHALTPLLDDRFAADLAFVEQVREAVPAEAPLLVYDDFGPLGASWFLYYLDGRAQLLHHPSFLLRDGVADEVFVITRRYTAPRFLGLAQSVKLAESERTQDEGRDDQRRFGLYRLRLHPGLARYRGPVYISPMQATGRALGPDLAGS